MTTDEASANQLGRIQLFEPEEIGGGDPLSSATIEGNGGSSDIPEDWSAATIEEEPELHRAEQRSQPRWKVVLSLGALGLASASAGMVIARRHHILNN